MDVGLIIDKFGAAGFEINAATAEKFAIYGEMLIFWNKKMNLTAVTDEEEIISRHFLDSLLPLNSPYIFSGADCIDIGTGAGFPGLPLAIMRPDIFMTLLDSLKKRVTFLDAVIAEIGLKNVTTTHIRAEDAAKTAFREYYPVNIAFRDISENKDAKLSDEKSNISSNNSTSCANIILNSENTDKAQADEKNIAFRESSDKIKSDENSNISSNNYTSCANIISNSENTGKAQADEKNIAFRESFDKIQSDENSNISSNNSTSCANIISNSENTDKAQADEKNIAFRESFDKIESNEKSNISSNNSTSCANIISNSENADKAQADEKNIAFRESSDKIQSDEKNIASRESFDIVFSRAKSTEKVLFREGFDIVFSRALSNMSTLAELCLPFVKVGGFMLALKSVSAEEETAKAQAAILTLGGRSKEIFGTKERNMIVTEKIHPTPNIYPRKAGTPEKNPISDQ